jgi:hypothetical protein
MKKFNYFLLIAWAIFFSTTTLNATTTITVNHSVTENVEIVFPFLPICISTYKIDSPILRWSKLQLEPANSSSPIQDKLNILYSICLALVLVNLVAQIKIIVQMIHLFFMFKKKDDVIGVKF